MMSDRARRLKSKLVTRYPSSQFTPIDAAAGQALRESFPGIPEEYIDLLTEVGWGNIGDGQFMLYQGPVEPATVFGREADSALRHIVLVGDDFAGHHAAYDTSTRPWRLVELEHTRPAEVSALPDQDLIAYLEAWYAS